MSWNRYPGRFLLLLYALCAALLVIEQVNGRFWLNDFRVYYEAARAWLDGAPLYGVPHGLSSGYFKYAPSLAMLFTPFAILPYPAAALIHYALIVLALGSTLVRADRLTRTHALGGSPPAYAPLFLALVLIVVHVHRELHLGNINILLLWLLVTGADALLSGRERAAGLLIGLAVVAKPHFAVLLPWLLLRGHRGALLAALAMVLLVLLLPFPILGAAEWMRLHGEWLGEMARHNDSLIYLGGDAYNSVDTVYSFLHRAFLDRFTTGSRLEAYAALAGIASLAGALVVYDRYRERGSGGVARNAFVEYILLLALVPSITLTDTNHFLLSAPLVLLLLHGLLSRLSLGWMLALCPPLLLYAANWADALGDLSREYVHYGLLGISNLGLLVAGTVILLRPLNHSPDRASST